MNVFKKRRQESKYSRGQWTVLRERFHIPAGKNPPGDSNFVQLSSVLGLVLKNIGKSDAVKAGSIENEWGGIIGARFAASTRPGFIEKNVLVVFVKDTVWLQELRLHVKKQALLERVRLIKGCGNVSSVRFELDPSRHDAGSPGRS